MTGTSSPLPRRVVLVLDDEPLMRLMWLQIAETLDVVVIPVATVAQALALLDGEAVDCVVCDWNLGRLETSQRLVVELLRRGQSLVVTSGDARALERLGAGCPTLNKPCSLDDVEAVLLGTWVHARASAPRARKAV